MDDDRSSLLAVPKKAHGRPVGAVHISKRLRHALSLMVENGLSQVEAAGQVGIHFGSLSRALRKPHVKELKRQLEQSSDVADRAFARVRLRHLAENAESEHVQLQAADKILERTKYLDENLNKVRDFNLATATPEEVVAFLRDVQVTLREVTIAPNPKPEPPSVVEGPVIDGDLV